MTTSDKIMLASAIAVVASTAVIVSSTKKYETATTSLISELQDINYLLSRTREDVISGNGQIVAGNKLLQDLVKKSVEVKNTNA